MAEWGGIKEYPEIVESYYKGVVLAVYIRYSL